jgi:hypothetical protein
LRNSFEHAYRQGWAREQKRGRAAGRYLTKLLASVPSWGQAVALLWWLRVGFEERTQR